MNNNIKELIEQYINEEHIKLMNKFNGSNFLSKPQKLFQQKFKSKISINVDIPGEQIVNDDFYERLMINVAGLLIEQYIAKFMINLFTSDTFKCKSGGITTERGKVHDFAIIYNVEDKTLKYSVPYGNNRNIHIFSTLDDCNDYIIKCKEIIINNLLSYYKTKISQYTTTVNKIESKIDDFLS